MTSDLRDTIFNTLGNKIFITEITMHKGGIICGVDHAVDLLSRLGCEIHMALPDGSCVAEKQCVIRFSGNAKSVAMAEDCAMGAIAKASGIARAAAKAVALADGKVRIVAGAAKKLPVEIKPQVRHAVYHGGAGGCICDTPFVYLDKNYVRMFGSVEKTLRGVSHMQGYTKVIQLRGLVEDIRTETQAALKGNAQILMVDTGNIDDLDAVAAIVRASGKRKEITIAFSGGIRLEDIKEICSHDTDILDIGRDVIDAPLADCRMDVTGEPGQLHTGAAEPKTTIWQHSAAKDINLVAGELDLLNKTEILLEGIALDGVNLTDFSASVARVLDLPSDKVAVIDVRPGQVALDVLMPSLKPEQFFGREKMLLAALGALRGVTLRPDAYVHSRGILGAISLNAEDVPSIIVSTTNMNKQMTVDSINKDSHILVFPTGFELIEKHIEDTNTPYLCKVLCEAGFLADPGQSLPDNRQSLSAALTEAAPECRAIITTGGVGAEDKDFSVEAIEALDPQAATPYLVRFPLGGRHVKDGIRIAVGSYKGSLLVALPGPHDEVRLVAPALVRGLKAKLPKHELAENIAVILREKLRASALQKEQHARWKH